MVGKFSFPSRGNRIDKGIHSCLDSEQDSSVGCCGIQLFYALLRVVM